MPDYADTLRAHEYAALRATIRERGTIRQVVIVVTFVSWAALVAAFWPLGPGAVLALAPLLVLAAGFEVVFALHSGVERIGRYLQLRYEAAGDPERSPAWETLAMDLGRSSPRTGAVPLSWPLFLLATALNSTAWLGASASAGSPLLIALAALLHAAFAVRVLTARRAAMAQRDRDLATIATWLAARTAR